MGRPDHFVPHVVRGGALVAGTEDTPSAPRWCLTELAGRFVELSGEGATAGLSFACALVRDAQESGEPTAWVTDRLRAFFPPDMARNGVDLGALVVVRVPATARLGRAAEHLVRSGALGLVVADLGGGVDMPPAIQARLASLARTHRTAVLCLTEKPARAPSLGPLVSLRCEVLRQPPDEKGWVRCTLFVLKDRRRGRSWRQEEVWRGPDGLC